MQNQVKLISTSKNSHYLSSLLTKNHDSYYLCKRMMDIIVALFLLAVLSPLMLFIAIGIKLSSPGPVFFVQKRIGAIRQYHGTRVFWKRTNFGCVKFRTMRIDSDSAIHRAYMAALIENDEAKMTALQGSATQPRKLVNDPRITWVGKILRKLSLDELPQLWNVVCGDMSLVGPRPAIPYEVDLYKTWHLIRTEAQPGISGLQQVTARSEVDFNNQIRLDIQYIENQSLWLDIKIMYKTIFVVISTKGAH